MQLMERITTEENLYAAWRLVRANRGGPGTDAVGLDAYEADLTANLTRLRRKLREESYVPLPLRRATMPKRDGGMRELAIPAVSDRVAQRAFVNVLDVVFEPLFLSCSFGYRPRRGVADAVEAVLAHREAGHGWILDADVQDFFPSVDHALLMERLRQHIRDRAVLRTIRLWLEAGAMAGSGIASPSLLTLAAARVREAAQSLVEGDAEPAWEGDNFNSLRRTVPGLVTRFGAEAARLAWDNRRTWLPFLATKGMMAGGGIGVAVLGVAVVGQHVLANRQPRTMGTPQGGPISPLLSNVYLHAFDEHMTAAGLRLVRYADDFVVCCASEARAYRAREIAAGQLGRLRLVLHPEKTRIVACADALRFLGHEFDQDGAFPVREEAPTTVQETVRQGVTLARSGVGAAHRVGISVTQEIAGRLSEFREEKG